MRTETEFLLCLSSCGRGPVGFSWRPRRAEAPGLVLPLTVVILSLSVLCLVLFRMGITSLDHRAAEGRVARRVWRRSCWQDVAVPGRDWASAVGSDERLWSTTAICPPRLTPVPGGLSGGDSSRGRGWRNGSRRWSVWSKLLIRRCAL